MRSTRQCDNTSHAESVEPAQLATAHERASPCDKADHRTQDNDTSNGDTVREHPASAAVAGEAGPLEVQGLPRDSAVLVVKRGPNAGSWFSLDLPVMSAGRDPGSDIFLDDISVSRHHADFRRDSGQIRVVDVDSLNGTYVNRKRVDSVVLTDGDEIQMGNFRLVYLTHVPRVDSYDIDGVG